MNAVPKKTFKLLGVTSLVVALAAAFTPLAAGATGNTADHGVRTHVANGTLHIRGSERADTVALRLAPDDASRVQVDIGSDDLSFSVEGVTALDVELGNGNDSALVDDSSGALTAALPTTIDGGPGADTLLGGIGAETFEGGSGDDFVVGGKGNDVAELGNGNDVFVWNPGDGSDPIEGRAGIDTMLFNEAGAEQVTMTANGGRLTFLRSPGNVTMDTDGVEIVDFNALGGADKITINDLTGTDVTETNIDLAGVLGGGTGDAIVDEVVVNGTEGTDTITIDRNGSGVEIAGLASAVTVSHPDTTDRLAVNTLEGTDDVSVTGVAGVMEVLVDGATL